MAAIKRTSLSAGEIVRTLLTNDAEVTKRVTKIVPTAVDELKTPYIVYRRSGMSTQPVSGRMSADTVTIEVYCYTAAYKQGIELAEAVRAALDGAQGETADGLRMRSCTLVSSSEDWQDDAYLQLLIFDIKI